MWSVGVVTFAMLTGSLPFYSDDPAIAMALMRGCQYNWPPDTAATPLAKDFVKKLLELDPSKRWSARQCLNHAWLRDINISIQ